MSSKNTFCILPWIHLFASTTGTLRPCCVSKEFEHRYKIHKEGIKEYWNSEHVRKLRQAMLNGERPDICFTCWDKEANGDTHSKRLGELANWQKRFNIDELINSTAADGSVEDNIVSYDLRLGNLCNLKCVMCNPNSSSKWLEDTAILDKYKNTGFSHHSLPNLKWPELDELWNYLEENGNKLRMLQFAGGEPLLHKKHYRLLEQLVEKGYSKNIFIKYNTNITKLPNKVFELWNEFKRVDLWCSLDGLDELNDYIRFPSKWQDMVDSLNILDNTTEHINIRVNTAVSALNIEYIPEFYNYIAHSNFKKIGKASWYDGVHIAPDIVYDPDHLNMRVLPKYAKEKITHKIKSHLETVENTQYKEQMNYVLTYMNSEDWSSNYDQLIRYVTELDNIRGNKYPYELYSTNK